MKYWRYLTVNDIKNMSEDEIAELTKTLSNQELKQYALMMGIKWTAIFAAAWFMKKALMDIESEVRNKSPRSK